MLRIYNLQKLVLIVTMKNNLKCEQTQHCSALPSFGVESFLNYYVDNAQHLKVDVGVHEEDINPTDADFQDLSLKIQAFIMDPKHRDRIAFLRLFRRI